MNGSLTPRVARHLAHLLAILTARAADDRATPDEAAALRTAAGEVSEILTQLLRPQATIRKTPVAPAEPPPPQPPTGSAPTPPPAPA